MEDGSGSQQTGRRQRAKGRGQEADAVEDDSRRRDRMDQAQQNEWGVRGSEEAGEEEKGSKEIQRRAPREGKPVMNWRERRDMPWIIAAFAIVGIGLVVAGFS